MTLSSADTSTYTSVSEINSVQNLSRGCVKEGAENGYNPNNAGTECMTLSWDLNTQILYFVFSFKRTLCPFNVNFKLRNNLMIDLIITAQYNFFPPIRYDIFTQDQKHLLFKQEKQYFTFYTLACIICTTEWKEWNPFSKVLRCNQTFNLALHELEQNQGRCHKIWARNIAKKEFFYISNVLNC